MSSACPLVLVLLLSGFASAQNQVGVPHTGTPIPPVDCALFGRSNSLAPTSVVLPLDSQRSLLEPNTAINSLVQSPSSSRNLIPDREAQNRPEEPAAWCVSSRSSDSNSPALTTPVLSSQELAQRTRSRAQVEPSLKGDTCYYIRSYLMARDSKDSDSTHLVGTSTCQPALQYGLKTTDPQPHALER
jgi:hypothetical protein